MGLRSEDEWLKQLTPREIAWLILELREQTWTSTWFTPDTARASIETLRRELLSRRNAELAPSPTKP